MAVLVITPRQHIRSWSRRRHSAAALRWLSRSYRAAPPGAEGGFGSLADVASCSRNRSCCWPAGSTTSPSISSSAGWEIRDSQRHRIPHLLMIPCLVMTFMLGPIGLLFYFAIRTAKTARSAWREHDRRARHRDALLFWTGASMPSSAGRPDLDRRHRMHAMQALPR